MALDHWGPYCTNPNCPNLAPERIAADIANVTEARRQFIFYVPDDENAEEWFDDLLAVLVLAYGAGNVTGALPPSGLEYHLGQLVPEAADEAA